MIVNPDYGKAGFFTIFQCVVVSGGNFVALADSSGAGKSTLLKKINQLVEPHLRNIDPNGQPSSRFR